MARLTNLTERGFKTQLEIRDVFLALILEKGYERVSIKDITERANIDRTTFYLHFKDKDDLFSKAQRDIIDELIELRSNGSGPFPGVRQTFEHMAGNPRLYLALFSSEGAAPRAGSLQEYLAQSMLPVLKSLLHGNGIADPDSAEPIAHYLAGALCNLSRWWLSSGMLKSPAEMSALFINLAASGVQSLKT